MKSVKSHKETMWLGRSRGDRRGGLGAPGGGRLLSVKVLKAWVSQLLCGVFRAAELGKSSLN